MEHKLDLNFGLLFQCSRQYLRLPFPICLVSVTDLNSYFCQPSSVLPSRPPTLRLCAPGSTYAPILNHFLSSHPLIPLISHTGPHSVTRADGHLTLGIPSMILGSLSSSPPGVPDCTRVSVPASVLGLCLFPSVLSLLPPSNPSTVQGPAQQVSYSHREPRMGHRLRDSTYHML